MATLPKTFQKLVVHKLTSNFREAVKIETVNMCHPKNDEICVKNKYVGVNATDVNISKGRYFVDATKLPFDIGFEGVGEVVAVGADVKTYKVGDHVAYLNSKLNAYSEYTCFPAAEAFPVPDAKPEYVVLLVSGLTATTGLDKAGRITEGESVLITAAAGGAGHVAVQWAKAAGCHVIGTCSSEDKAKILKELGCDRIVNYKKEDLGEVLENEYKNGVDVIWETIGGKVFEDCFRNIAIKGRLLVVGSISGYKTEDKAASTRLDLSTLPEKLLFKSASVQGFLLLHYQECFPTYLKYMMERLQGGELKVLVDDGKSLTGKEFFGLEGIIRAVEHLHSGKSVGKVVARIS
ncbi:prostaglandin reductase 3-like [Uloborus diversus]|uniref:prostaglandin reductase 3-like n=1 Tax=Uloborus diversus TaxID=327109 RepID=UPI00240A13EC|nr:prostaglandin reductase 3-like [Uloborus diversus]